MEQRVCLCHAAIFHGIFISFSSDSLAIQRILITNTYPYHIHHQWRIEHVHRIQSADDNGNYDSAKI